LGQNQKAFYKKIASQEWAVWPLGSSFVPVILCGNNEKGKIARNRKGNINPLASSGTPSLPEGKIVHLTCTWAGAPITTRMFD